MKIELEIPESVAQAVAEEVTASLRPLLVTKKAEEEDQILTPEQLAKYLQVAKQWVYERVSLGEIPHFKAGKYLRFKKSAVDKWIEAQSVPASSPCSRRLKITKSGESR